MWQIDKLELVLTGRLGDKEQPPDSNNTVYTRDYGAIGAPWCVIYLWWCFREAGLSACFYGGQKTASCGQLLTWARDNHEIVPISAVQRGDVVLLSFSGSSAPEHCGWVTDASNGTILTIEGNTSASGSQDNGGIVMRKTRKARNVVAVWRPDYAMVTDYSGRWSEPVIRQVIERGIMTGDPDGRFRPRDPATREELAAVAARILEVIDRE